MWHWRPKCVSGRALWLEREVFAKTSFALGGGKSRSKACLGSFHPVHSGMLSGLSATICHCPSEEGSCWPSMTPPSSSSSLTSSLCSWLYIWNVSSCFLGCWALPVVLSLCHMYMTLLFSFWSNFYDFGLIHKISYLQSPWFSPLDTWHSYVYCISTWVSPSLLLFCILSSKLFLEDTGCALSSLQKVSTVYYLVNVWMNNNNLRKS